MEWMIVAGLICTICGFLFFLARRLRVVRAALGLLAIVVSLPVLYLLLEFLLLYVIGRSIVPQTGVFLGILVPPPTYFRPLLSMPLGQGVQVYSGAFKCRHFGRHELNIEMEKHDGIGNEEIDVDFDLRYVIYDRSGIQLASGMARKGRQNSKSEFWPYVYCARFDVPTQVPRNEEVNIRIEVSSGFQSFVKRTSCARFVVMKVSDE